MSDTTVRECEDYDEVLEFINRRFKEDCHWIDGNCYYFAAILCSRFKYLNMYYAPVAGHFVAGYNGQFYDWCGKYKEDENPILFTEIEHTDPKWYKMIVDGCVV